MTIATAAAPDAAADIRWRAWQVRGAAHDRRRAAAVRALGACVALGLAVWLSVQLF